MKHIKQLEILVAAFCFLMPVAADSADYPYRGEMIGAEQLYRVKENESLWEIARRFDVGINEIGDANPALDPIIPPTGATVDIPTAWILPDLPQYDGIVINIPEFRLFYFPQENRGGVLTFPVGIGDEGKDTPVGNYRVVEKIVSPAWYVPESIRREKPELPRVVPPGPNNPMGSHAMRLSERTILIHGTDRPWGIGTRSSHGCLRLFPEDIVRLFALVPIGTRVTIVNQPVKAALVGERVFVEIHRYDDIDYRGAVVKVLGKKKLLDKVSFARLERAVKEKKGMPVDVTR